MEALDLHVKDHVAVELSAGDLLDVGGEALLVGALGLLHGVQEARVLLEGDELLELVGVVQPAGADGVGDELGVGRVGLAQEPAVRDAVGLVVEHLGIELVELLEGVALQDVGVQRRDAVDGVAEDDGQVGHAHLAVPQNGGVAQDVGPGAVLRRELLG